MRRAAMRDYSAPSRFQSTHPVWDATGEMRKLERYGLISIHASRMGCDLTKIGNLPANPTFQSTHPVWDATQGVRDFRGVVPISIHASRMGCDPGCEIRGSDLVISIHASRMGCDTLFLLSSWKVLDFNPRIPYGMRRVHVDEDCVLRRFQSTHPVWDAT